MGPNNIRSVSLIFLFLLLSGIAAPQTPTTCVVSAVPPIVHSEGLAERLGDIVLQCTGNPGVSVTANLSIILPVSITNRINAESFATGANLTINTGSGPVQSGVSGLVTNQSIAFSGFSFTFPASGTATVTIDDLRADVNQLGLQQQAPIQAFLSGSLALHSNPVTVAVAQQGLLATSMDSGVTCVGSPAPASNSLTSLFAAKTSEQTTRVTEGFPQAFAPKDPTSDTGTRILLNYTNFPSTAAVYVPDFVAGSTALVPTAGGDLGTPATVGQYTPGSQTLLLVRVLNADATGNGGTLTPLPAPNSSGVLVLDSANPVSLTSGAGYAVYEVAAADPFATESAQIPNFFVIPPNTAPAMANGSLSLAPVSTVTSATATDPIPRFEAVQPPSDCSANSDCNASYYPQLQVNTQPMQATAVAGGRSVLEGYLSIKNLHGGVLGWAASVTYTSGTGWLQLSQSFGIVSGYVEVAGNPSALAPGTYQATISVDAGNAGSQSIPVTLTVTASAQPSIVISSIADAADFHPGPVAPGELASIFGGNFSGQNVSVMFGSVPAHLLYTGATQINLQVPPQLAGQSSSQVLVTVDGSSSAPMTVQLAAIAPAVFNPGILNQDNTLNSPSHPAPLGSVLQIFGTGMPDSGSAVSVNIQNRTNLVPLYAGAAPGLLGLQQVNVVVPADLPVATSNLTVCVTGGGNQQYCSQPQSIYLK